MIFNVIEPLNFMFWNASLFPIITCMFTRRCDWSAITDKPPKKLPRHIPMHLRKKMKEKPPPKYFEVEPPSGILLPGQTLDIRIKFMPSEEVHTQAES